MASEAQVRANRLNAQKSAGPRTAEGKEKASQNSLKHGLFAREGVIRGEDREEYDMHREMLLEQLDPAGPLEAILAARVVDLSWRLRRAAQDQNEAFGALYDKCVAREVAGPEAGAGGGTGVPPSNRESETLTTRGQDARDTDTARGQSLPPTQAGDARDMDTPGERGTLLGRMILEDFEQEAVLERLLRYERRIESSFYRTLNELRRVHDQGRKADQEVAGTLGRWRQEDGEARKARAFACEVPGDGSPRPAGATTNTPGGGDDCGLRISDCGLKDAGLEEQTLALVPHDSTVPSFQHSNSAPAPPDQLCKTNPISKCEVPSLKSEVSDRKGHVPGALTSNFTLQTSNSPPNLPVGGIACKTNPISPDPDEGLAAWGEQVRNDANPYDTTRCHCECSEASSTPRD